MSSFRRQLAWTMVLQGSGAAAAALAIVWIGAALGPVQQGRFNEMKSLVELGAALAMLGMPQALYVFAQRGELSLLRARRIAGRVAAVGLPVGAVLAMWVLAPGIGVPMPVLALAVAVAVALASLQGQWRALALLAPRSMAFNIATAAPQWALLGLAAGVVMAGGASAPALACGLAAVWLVGGVIARAAMPVAGPAAGAAAMPVGLVALARFGAATWLTASLAAASIVLLQQLARTHGGVADLGRVSMAAMLAQMPLVPLNYALPLLLRRRLQAAGPAEPLRTAGWVTLSLLVLVGLVLLAGRWRDDLGLGAGYAGLHRLLAWLLLAAAADAAARLLAVEAQAQARPWRTTWAEAARVAVLLTGPASGATLGGVGAAESLVRWNALAAWIGVVLLWRLGRRP